ncbi:MAG TPA: GNAT family N-acetyltransferase [Chlamydiales bacterium]|nr:GNAT family N-acetyltransferase [Chlamydiales bacterium]
MDNSQENILETERLIARRMTRNDHALIMTLFSDPLVMHYYTRTRTEEEGRCWIEKVLDDYAKHGCGLWVWHLKQTGEFVGQCGLRFQTDIGDQGEIEVSYMLLPKFWNQGLGAEAAKAVMEYARKMCGYKRLISLIRPENIASRRVAEKNGFKEEKVIVYQSQYLLEKLPHIIYVSQA